MDSFVSPKDEICFLRVCHHISTGLYPCFWDATTRHWVISRRFETTTFSANRVIITQWRGASSKENGYPRGVTFSCKQNFDHKFLVEHPGEHLSHYGLRFISAFALLRKATICFVMSVRLSFRPSAWNNSAPIGRIFVKFDIWGFSENLFRKYTFIKIWQE
jgi:hypothetical protein